MSRRARQRAAARPWERPDVFFGLCAKHHEPDHDDEQDEGSVFDEVSLEDVERLEANDGQAGVKL